jgi:hypothetical protein
VDEGHARIEESVDASRPQLEELLAASSLSMLEAAGAGSSLVAARWMIEMMGGTLTVRDGGSILCIDLPAVRGEACVQPALRA